MNFDKVVNWIMIIWLVIVFTMSVLIGYIIGMVLGNIILLLLIMDERRSRSKER